MQSRKPRVLNRHLDQIPPEAVYVGRPSPYGNSFTIGRDGTREQVIEKYELWVMNQIRAGKLDLSKLRGRDLVCWCAPKPCHADVLLRLAN